MHERRTGPEQWEEGLHARCEALFDRDVFEHGEGFKAVGVECLQKVIMKLQDASGDIAAAARLLTAIDEARTR